MTNEKNKSLIISNGLPALNNYEAYKRYVRSIPNLTEEEEERLVQEMLKEKNIEAAKKLIVSQLKNVVYIAEQYKNYGLPEEDLVQEGNIGLMKAVKNFNPEKKVRLYTYALIWIKAEIQTYVMKNLKMVNLPSSKPMKKLFFNFRKLQNEMISLGISKDKITKFMSAKLEVSEEDVLEAQKYFLSDDISIYDKLNDEQDEQINPVLEKFLIDNNRPEDWIENEQIEKNKEYIVEDMIGTLNDRQKTVIEMRYLTEDKKTHKEIAEIMGISNERVRQIEKESIVKMKKRFLNSHNEKDIHDVF
jgi:RNA polymerase sigma-32 factor